MKNNNNKLYTGWYFHTSCLMYNNKIVVLASIFVYIVYRCTIRIEALKGSNAPHQCGCFIFNVFGYIRIAIISSIFAPSVLSLSLPSFITSPTWCPMPYVNDIEIREFIAFRWLQYAADIVRLLYKTLLLCELHCNVQISAPLRLKYNRANIRLMCTKKKRLFYLQLTV